MVTGVNNLGSVLQALGDLAGAKANYERALPNRRGRLGPHHPTVATLRESRDRIFQEPGD